MTRFVCFLAAALCFATVPARAQANVAKLITKARAYLGSEETLNSIKSIHYFGTLETEEIVKDKDGKETARPFKGSVEIIFQKPCRQRVELTSDRGTDITVLDDYDGWRRLQPAGSPHWSLTILNPVQVERLRANTWENLAFYRGLERFGGHINDLGPATIDGQACEKVAFVHSPDIVFYRYINTATGKLLLTETENGSRLREEGKIIVNGVRFLKKLITVTKDATGRENTVTITMDKITLNDTFPDSLFAAPLVTPTEN